MLRVLAAAMVFDTPILGWAVGTAGATMARFTDAHRLLSKCELTAAFPEGYRGLGMHFKDRYTLERFGRGRWCGACSAPPMNPT